MAFIQVGGSPGATTNILSQNISGFQIGHSYAVTYYDQRREDDTYTEFADMSVSLGDQVVVPNHVVFLPNSEETYEFVQSSTFIATSTSNLLQFIVSNHAGGGAVLLDDVSIIEVPEPAGIIAPQSYAVNVQKDSATVTIQDSAPTVTVASSGRASRVDGAGKGAGVFTFTRTSQNVGLPLTVDFTLGGTGTEGMDFATLATHTVTFFPGKTTASLTVNPIDSLALGAATVSLTIATNGSPGTYHIGAKSTAAISIAADSRDIILGTVSPLSGTSQNTPLDISFNDLVAATGAVDRTGSPITFKVTKIVSGTLKKKWCSRGGPSFDYIRRRADMDSGVEFYWDGGGV